MISDSLDNSISEQIGLSEYLITNIVGKASGSLENECQINYPRDIYFIGNLSPRNDNESSLSKRDFFQKLSPSAFGAEFRFKPPQGKTEVTVVLTWNCYYRLFPKYEQQMKYMGAVDALDHSKREHLLPKFKKVPCKAQGKIVISYNDGEWFTDLNDLTKSIDEEFDKINIQIVDDPESYKIKTVGTQFKIPQAAFVTEAAYFQYLSQFKLIPNPRWKWEIKITAYPYDGVINDHVILFQFVNATQTLPSDKTVEPYFFDTKASFGFPSNVVSPFELELATTGFRYNRELQGKGFNCGVQYKEEESIYETTNVPKYDQPRYSTSAYPTAHFEDIIEDPLFVLNKILQEMKRSVENWSEQEKEYEILFGTQIWKQKHKGAYDKDLNSFLEEIERYKLGIDLIENDPDIRLAFGLTNEVFRDAGLDKNGNIKKKGWRLFQLVFLVTEILSISALEKKYHRFLKEREKVDIIYFPTGGGKTEAYLATLVFHCFYDRLRGKTAGITAWIRFPLRLLTIQQTQRLADVIGIAEIIRKQQKDVRLNGKTIPKFSVGYFVGTEGTPNELIVPSSQGMVSENWSIASDPIIRQKWKRIISCPSCKTNSVSIDFDESKVKVIHKCTNTNCRFEKGIIPIYIIDNEIYRYLPTVVVGTIDKLSVIGFQRKVSMMFGRIDGYCNIHGFYNGKCSVKSCKDEKLLVANIPAGLSGPTLFLQDELHLLREGVGTFDSHYETFAQRLLKEFNGDLPIKIIASSATIEKYERQVQHLYGKPERSARLFPSLGPTNKYSFYAETKNYPQRIYIGILPHNKTILRTILEILEYYHVAIQDLFKLSAGSPNPFGGKTKPGTEEWFALLDLYCSSLTYFQANRDLDKVKSEIETYINNEQFKNNGYEPVNVRQLTGDTSTDEVTKTLEALETKHLKIDQHDAILANNMISHGVDIDRLNSMLFFGMPKANAEYIQASSRVGRTHVGLVINCFNPTKERDQSHYSYFTKYHEFLGQLVEPVAINRWSAYGIDKTLPGLFLGVLLQIYSNKEIGSNRDAYRYANKINKLYTERKLSKEDIKTILKEAYTADLDGDIRNIAFHKKIDKAIDVFMDNILNTAKEDATVSDSIFPPPMSSLRDIDEKITIEIDSLGNQWYKTK